MSEFVYDPHRIEEHWQAEWVREDLYRACEDTGKPKKYVLEMFPYPSGDIHMGHVRNYTIGDVVARQASMAGFNVLHPIGWDAFGLPAENAAIKSNTHPSEWTYANIETQAASFKRMGFSYDWDRTVRTCDVDFYRWGQWIFLKFWERGLVERKCSPVNWCPGCKTVLANEQVLGDGTCWRCKSVVEKRELEQWFYKITEYAQQLLDDLDELPGWPERVKTMQANWIGRSEGAEVEFALCDEGGTATDERITVFTTRPDTLFGCTFFLLAPEHPLVKRFVAGTEYEAAVMDVVASAARETAVERQMGERVKRGAFTGRYVVNPGQRRERAGMGLRLRAHGLRHRRGHGGSERRPARLRVRPPVRPADRPRCSSRRGGRALLVGDPGRGAAGSRVGAGVRRSRCHDQLGRVRWDGGRQGQRRHARGDRVARRARTRPLGDQLPPARLAHLAPALLGQPDPGDPLPELRPGAGAHRGPAAGRAAR